MDKPPQLPKHPEMPTREHVQPPKHIVLYSDAEYPGSFREKHAWIYDDGHVVLRFMDSTGMEEICLFLSEMEDLLHYFVSVRYDATKKGNDNGGQA